VARAMREPGATVILETEAAGLGIHRRGRIAVLLIMTVLVGMVCWTIADSGRTTHGGVRAYLGCTPSSADITARVTSSASLLAVQLADRHQATEAAAFRSTG
jgi:hypothetical protein